MRRGYRRAGRLLAGGLASLALIVFGGAIGFFAYTRLVFGLTLQDQVVLLRLPPVLEARVRAVNPVAVRLDGEVSARIPLKQSFTVPMRGSYEADAAFEADIPLRMVMHYRGVVPVDAVADLAGHTGLVVDRRWLPKFPLRAKVPLRFDFPVDLTVPLDTRIRLAYRGPVRFAFDQTLTVPVDTVLRTRFHLDRDAEAPVQTAFMLRAYPPQRPVPLRIDHARLSLPASHLRLQRTD